VLRLVGHLLIHSINLLTNVRHWTLHLNQMNSIFPHAVSFKNYLVITLYLSRDPPIYEVFPENFQTKVYRKEIDNIFSVSK